MLWGGSSDEWRPGVGQGRGWGSSDSLGHSIHSFCLFWGQPETLGRIVTFVAWWPNREVILVLVITTNTFTETFMQIFKMANKNIDKWQWFSFQQPQYYFNFYSFVEVYFIYSVSSIQQRDLVICMYISFCRFFSITRYYKTLNLVPCAIQHILVCLLCI